MNETDSGNFVRVYNEIVRFKSETEMTVISGKPTVYPTYRSSLAKRGYLVGESLGAGSYSRVKTAVHVKANKLKRVAIKIIDKEKAPSDYLEKFLPRELNIWNALSHSNIAALLDCFCDSKRIYMVVEFAKNGDCLKHIQKHNAVSETRAKLWLTQVCNGVSYLHLEGIAHRDLKLENLLLDAHMNIKLCDFGFVRRCPEDKLSSTYCGSKSYAAPEILQGKPYNPKLADVWAIGVILYIMVAGRMPFDESKGNQVILKEQKELKLSWSQQNPISQECIALIHRMFTFDYRKRPDIGQVVVDPWFQRTATSKPTDSETKLANESKRRLQKYIIGTNKPGTCLSEAAGEGLVTGQAKAPKTERRLQLARIPDKLRAPCELANSNLQSFDTSKQPIATIKGSGTTVVTNRYQLRVRKPAKMA